MLLVPALFLGLLVGFSMEEEVLTQVTHEELYSQIGNRHILKKMNDPKILNLKEGVVTIEYFPRDCRVAFLRGHKENGLYIILPKNGPPLLVFCDFQDDGGWTVIQRNNRDESFVWSKSWDMYKFGFGDLRANHWLGNEFIYRLTMQNGFSVRFSLVDSKGQPRNADYHSFRVDSEKNRYALRLGSYSGDAGDALTVMNETGVHDNMKFTTSDWDNDRWKNNCADYNQGGWWYDNCQSALLNSDLGIFWAGLCSQQNPCHSATIMVKPNKINCDAGKFPDMGDIPSHRPY